MLSDGESTRTTIVNALSSAALHGHIELVQLLLTHLIDNEESNRSKQLALFQAIAGCHLAVCELLLRHGTSLNIPDETGPLHMAALIGHTEMCKLFIQHGANINQKNSDGATPLYFAALYSHVDAYKLLLSLGADFGFTDHKKLLSCVIANGNIELINDLLERGAKLNAPPGERT
ncbi:MAG: hypothetical protein RIQ85_1784, partial [Pseudomonadota bacterium]